VVVVFAYGPIPRTAYCPTSQNTERVDVAIGARGLQVACQAADKKRSAPATIGYR
jgi:hypothetical protein